MPRFYSPVKPDRFLLTCLLVTTCILHAQPGPPSPMNAIDHGPFVSSTISSDPQSTRSIFVYKGIAAQVGPQDEGVMVFDTDLLRVASAWTGGFLKWYPARDGLQEFPSPDGFTHFSTSQRPGWSLDGKFGDPRPWKYGPVPKSLGAYNGLYKHGDQLVYSYRIGKTKLLESPGYKQIQGKSVFTRTLSLSATEDSLSAQLLQTPDGYSTRLEVEMLSPRTGYISIQSGDQSRLVGFRGLPENAAWRLSERHLILDLPPLAQPLEFELSIGPIAQATEIDYMTAHLRNQSGFTDLKRLQQPGATQWETLETQLSTDDQGGPFAVDNLTLPTDNPWNSFLRFSGVDFLSDGRAVVTSLSGEVWLVSGLEAGSTTLVWTRFATGLSQPHGVKVVDDRIYVTGRDQITLLHDRNNNGEADYYENFNNDVMAATNFHAFTMNLDTDSKGNFYFAKATPWPPERNGVAAEITPHHGVLFRMPPDGSKLDVIATGLRNPNGLSIGPDDDILYSDNEGNWVPTSKVHRIRDGGFHGFQYSAHQSPSPTDFEKPILWVPHFIDNSSSAPIFITSKTWPAELQGQLLLNSYGRGNLSLIMKEEVDGQWQGAHLNLPLKFQSGTIHGRFHSDGHLYIAGLTSWQSVGHGGDWGSFHRVRYTGKPLHLPVAVNTRKGGLDLQFAEALDPASATNLKNYLLKQWTYPWTSQYGTRGKVYSINHPGETVADDVVIRSIQISKDKKTIQLEIPTLRQDLAQKTLGVLPELPDMIETPMGLVMAIDYRIQSADGTEMKHLIHKTIHKVAGDEATFTPTVATSTPVNPAGSQRSKQVGTVSEGIRVVELRSTGIALSFDVTEIRAKAGERLAIRFVNASDMAHNIVLVKSEADISPVGIAAIMAQTDEFVPQQEMDRILAASNLAYPGDTVVVEFTVPGPGTYPYICTFSGHFTMMQGRLIVEP